MSGGAQPQDWPYLKKYQAENANLALAESEANRVVFYGDSVTEFWKNRRPDFFSKNNYVNRGISGQTSPQMLIRFRADVINLQPKIVVILAGGNDIAGNTGPATLEMILNNLRSMTELARVNQIKVILCSVLPTNYLFWNPKQQPAAEIKALNDLIRNYALQQSITFVDYYSAMVDEHMGMKESYSDDRVHPNEQGYEVMEPLIKKAIENLLKI